MSDDIKNRYYQQFMEQFNLEQNQHIHESDDEEYCPDPDINIDDYIPADQVEESMEIVYRNDVNVINILTTHYRLAHNTSNISLFDGLDKTDDPTATNKILEFVYGEIFRFARSEIPDKNVMYEADSNINIDTYKEFYCLMINGEPVYVCPFVIPLASHLATLDWLEMDWEIIDLLETEF